MGNLRDKYTDDEWNKIENRISSDRKPGKPEETEIYLNMSNKSIESLLELRGALSKLYDSYQLNLLDKWIKWKM